jgi:3-hydroxyacyl-CoA dehydrogenase
MKAGFGWENGPFEIWDAIGVEKELKSWKPKVLSLLQVTEMIASGSKSFLLLKKELPISTIFQLNHKLKFRVKMPLSEQHSWNQKSLDNSGAIIQDLGDGILNRIPI